MVIALCLLSVAVVDRQVMVMWLRSVTVVDRQAIFSRASTEISNIEVALFFQCLTFVDQ